MFTSVQQHPDDEMVPQADSRSVLDKEQDLVYFLLREHLHLSLASGGHLDPVFAQLDDLLCCQLTVDQEQVERLQRIDLLVDRRDGVLSFRQVILVAGDVETFQIGRLIYAHRCEELRECLYITDVGLNRFRRDPILHKVLFELLNHVHCQTPPEIQKSRRLL